MIWSRPWQSFDFASGFVLANLGTLSAKEEVQIQQILFEHGRPFGKVGQPVSIGGRLAQITWFLSWLHR